MELTENQRNDLRPEEFEIRHIDAETTFAQHRTDSETLGVTLIKMGCRPAANW